MSSYWRPGESIKPIHQLNERDIEQLTSLFHQWEVKPGGTEGYHKAEVTIGGVESAELSSKTFEFVVRLNGARRLFRDRLGGHGG